MNIIQRLVQEDKLKKAIDHLLSNCIWDDQEKREIILLAGQFTENDKNDRLGLMDRRSLGVIKNRIRNAILVYADKCKGIEEEIDLYKNSSFSLNNFIGLGNEPGWSLSITDQYIIFVSDYGEKTHVYEITDKFFGEKIWHFRSNKLLLETRMAISVTITKETWKDNMSGLKYDFRVEITENFRHYIGVGQLKNEAAHNKG